MNPLMRKLENFVQLDAQDRQLLDRVVMPVRTVPARVDIISEGDAPSDVHLVLSGFACRSKITTEGSRQIMAYLVPGISAIST